MLCDDTLQCVFATLPPHVLQYVKRVSRQFRRCARNTIHGDWLENIDGEIDFRHKVSVNTFALEIPGVGMFSSVEEVVHVIGMDAHWKTHYDFLNATTPYLKVGRCRFPFAPKPEIEESFCDLYTGAVLMSPAVIVRPGGSAVCYPRKYPVTA